MISDEIKVVRPKTVALNKLHIRYIPIVTPIELWQYDMSLESSPHVELMEIFLTHGLDWKRITKSRYYLERRHRHYIGMDRWDDAKTMSHIIDRYKIFRSIRKRGYKKNKKDPVYVLNRPFWKTRFGFDEDWVKGKELWNGAGRCSAAYVLGLEQLKVVMCEDKYPGTKKKGKFEDKLKNVKGVWE